MGSSGGRPLVAACTDRLAPTHNASPAWPEPSRRYEMRDLLAIESGWLIELAPHMYRLAPLNPQMRR